MPEILEGLLYIAGLMIVVALVAPFISGGKVWW